MKARALKISPAEATSFLCFRRVDRRFGFNWHFHPEIELTLIVKSRGKRFVGDSIADYQDGDLVLLGPNVPHTWDSEPTASGQHEAVVCAFSEAFMGVDFFKTPEMEPVAALLRRSERALRFTGKARDAAQKIMDGMEKLPTTGRLLALLEVLVLLSRSRDVETLVSREFVPSFRLKDAKRIDRVCRFLTENYKESIGLPEAAKIAHLTPSAFSRFFKNKTRKTFVAYLNELRIGHACRRLLESEDTVSEIAFGAGFNNLSNFNRWFLEMKKMRPRDFRVQFRAQE